MELIQAAFNDYLFYGLFIVYLSIITILGITGSINKFVLQLMFAIGYTCSTLFGIILSMRIVYMLYSNSMALTVFWTQVLLGLLSYGIVLCTYMPIDKCKKRLNTKEERKVQV